MNQLDLTNDELLTTTRAVRKRLNLERPVEREIIEECLKIACQAPTGGNVNRNRWIVVDDRETIEKLAKVYTEAQLSFIKETEKTGYLGADVPGFEKMASSVDYLRENFHRLPAVLVPVIAGRTDQTANNAAQQAGIWGSILQSVWSFMLALRARGLGSCWTNIHMRQERDVAEILGIPYDEYMQVGMFPIAYTIGTDFKPGRRTDLNEILTWNKF